MARGALSAEPVSTSAGGAVFRLCSLTPGTPLKLATNDARENTTYWVRVSLHFRKRLNNSSWSSTLRAAAPLLVLRKVLNSLTCWSAASDSCAASQLRAGSKRRQPGTSAARLTSCHFGWRGGLRNSSNCPKNASTNLFSLK